MEPTSDEWRTHRFRRMLCKIDIALPLQKPHTISDPIIFDIEYKIGLGWDWFWIKIGTLASVSGNGCK